MPAASLAASRFRGSLGAALAPLEKMLSPAEAMASQAVVQFHEVQSAVPRGRQIFNVLLVILLMVLFAAVYKRLKGEPRMGCVTPRTKQRANEGLYNGDEDRQPYFAHSLFGCFDNIAVCAVSFVCPGIRWADTLRMAGFMTFWMAIVLMALVELGTLFGLLGLIIFVVLGVFFRQQMRVAFGMDAGGITLLTDCLSYTFCPCCTVAQEAQQYEDAWNAEHPVAKNVLAMQRTVGPAYDSATTNGY